MKTFRGPPSAGEQMATVLRNTRSLIPIDWLQPRNTIRSPGYVAILKELSRLEAAKEMGEECFLPAGNSSSAYELFQRKYLEKARYLWTISWPLSVVKNKSKTEIPR